MSPKKAPGADGLTSDICNRAYKTNPRILIGIYNKCLELAYFPKSWKVATIKILPKPQKPDYSIPKAYRPIGLLPILGKALEKLFANRILWYLGNQNALNPKQYGFMPQKSTEDALYEAVSKIEKAIKGKKIAVAVSLDIEGAFDNAWWPAVKNQLLVKKLDPALIQLVSSYLSERGIEIRYSGERAVKRTTKGCIQGSTCGPLLWNLLLDSLLEKTSGMKVYLQAFADDILLIGVGDDGKNIEEDINSALKIILAWGRDNKLNFAPHKTQATLFTKKLKFQNPRLTIDNTVIQLQEHLKILGLTLDKNLNYLKHLDETTGKAINLFKAVSKTARAHWGLNPDIIRTIYISVVEPTILYAANVWAVKSQTVQVKKRLDRINRMFGILICKGHKTISGTSAKILGGLLPLDLRSLEKKSLYEAKRTKQIDQLPGRPMEIKASPFSLPHPALRTTIPFDCVENQEQVEEVSKNEPCIFTDGSKIEGKVGAAISVWVEGKEVHYKLYPLEGYCSVYQAELVAVRGALETIASKNYLQKSHIFCDSRAALQSLSNPQNLNPIVVEIRDIGRNLCRSGKQVQFHWIRAHVGTEGNERADNLAKTAATKSKTRKVYDRFPVSLAKHLIRANTISTWQDIYNSEVTGVTSRTFFPNVKQAYKTLDHIKMDNLKAQILTGHGGFKSYLFRFKLAADPFCSCDNATLETIEHLLTECPRFSLLRHDCESKMGLALVTNNLYVAINSEKFRSCFMAYACQVARIAARANGSKV
ncbi:putative 115 kDa protein in type-1 retrotransposable element R1DM [Bicyclus anynana]|uniref:115 kDa protein in type-1 retrotransposable element R1DM n=1 Tax=Bicyclus anynana TaxID=110368 RepID=A0ABM3LQ14_BICAN|nr:putative 115 kDa protein in type-1 retrotransposable element R1DM [Bicyclus anynana]